MVRMEALMWLNDLRNMVFDDSIIGLIVCIIIPAASVCFNLSLFLSSFIESVIEISLQSLRETLTRSA